MKGTLHTGLQGLREAHGKTRLEVAHAIGMTERHLSRIEKGDVGARRSHLFALASVYGVPLEEVERALAA